MAYGDGSTGYYDVRRKSLVAGPPDEGEIGGAWLSAGHMYVAYAVGDASDPRREIRSTDLDTLQRTDLLIEIDDCDVPFLSSVFVSAAANGSRVAVTYPGPTDLATDIYDGRTGELAGEPLVGPYTTSFGPDGTLVTSATPPARSPCMTRTPLSRSAPSPEPVDLSTASTSVPTAACFVASSNLNMSIYDVATRTRLGDPIASDLPLVAATPDRRSGRTARLW